MLLDSGKGKDSSPEKERKNYPWHLLAEAGDYFVWSDISDAKSIRGNARYHGMKLSCKINKADNTLTVLRLKGENQ